MRRMIVAIVAAIAVVPAGESRGQNDWQYPDPYFGILEIEKSREPAARGENSALPRLTWQRPPAKGRSIGARGRWRQPGSSTAGGRGRPTVDR
jgi:hypothetical protein